MVAVLTHLVVGPPEHGVSRYAARLARVAPGRNELVSVPEAAAEVDVSGRRVVVHFTDRLFGADAQSAARRLVGMCALADDVTVVLHDLPQASDGAPRRCRGLGYLEVCDLASTVVVNSEHEALLLRALARCRGESWAEALRRRTHVLPLPVPEPVESAGLPVPDDPPTVATLGFLYPGKGVEEVIDAAGVLSRPPRVVNLGRASAGHDGLVGELSERAAAVGVEWSTTGWLGDADLSTRMRSVTVPVAAHRHLSASGSISSWVGAGRRPLVTRSRYAMEMAERMPSALAVVDELAPALAAALADPGTTWLGQNERPGRTEAEVAARLVAIAGSAG